MKKSFVKFIRIVRAIVMPLLATVCILSGVIYQGYDFFNINSGSSNSPFPSSVSPGNRSFLNGTLLFPKTLTVSTFYKLFQIPKAQLLGDYGKGERILLIEYGQGYSQKDFSTFNHTMHIENSTANIHTIRVLGPQLSYSGETMLDAEWIHAVAPLAEIYIAELASPNDMPLIEQYAKDIHANIMSSSIGLKQPDNFANSHQSLLKSSNLLKPTSFVSTAWLLAQQIPVFWASGDYGSSLGVDSNPNIVSVGGIRFNSIPTSLQLSHSSFIKWGSSGGSYSDFMFFRPTWQFNHKSTWRVTPDVSMIAGSPYVWVYANNVWTPMQGTSIAAPIWAGLWALADQAHYIRTRTHLPSDANQILYYVAKHYPNTFITGTSGNSIGLGIPNVPQLISVLSTLQPPHQITTNFSAVGVIRIFKVLYLASSVLLTLLVIITFITKNPLASKLKSAFLLIYISFIMSVIGPNSFAAVPVITRDALLVFFILVPWGILIPFRFWTKAWQTAIKLITPDRQTSN